MTDVAPQVRRPRHHSERHNRQHEQRCQIRARGAPEAADLPQSQPATRPVILRRMNARGRVSCVNNRLRGPPGLSLSARAANADQAPAAAPQMMKNTRGDFRQVVVLRTNDTEQPRRAPYDGGKMIQQQVHMRQIPKVCNGWHTR